MTDEKKEPKDIVSGFDLPENQPTPPPPGTGPTASPSDFDLPEDAAVAPPFVSAAGQPAGVEPHVRREEARGNKQQSIAGKLIALVAIPVIAIVVLLFLRESKQQPWLAYQADCVKTASEFIKGLSDGTDDSVPASYLLLSGPIRESKDVEWVQANYKAAVGTLGAFVSLESPKWDSAVGGQAPQSFGATVKFENGGCSAWFEFIRVKVDGKTEMRISNYRFGAK